jgi:ferredoxin-NADP reductase
VASAPRPLPDIGTQADAYPLRVAAVTREADEVLSLSLRHPEGGDLPAWQPGAHIELQLPSGRIRQYSLYGSPRSRGEYRIAVLREKAGRGGSAEIHDLPLTGMQLVVRGPRNHFPLKDSPRYLFIAGGIGVTPILPMITEVGPDRPWAMYYGGRSRASMAFAERALRIGGDRVHIQPEDESGLLDVAGIVGAADARTAIYCCGPQGLLDAVQDARRRLSPGASLYTERFTPGPPAPAQSPAQGAAQDRPFRVELKRSGRTLLVPADRTLLDVIRDVVPDVPYSCEEGYCGTCETKVLGGRPDHRDEILFPEERAKNNTMMICVGRALSETLVLDL